MLETRSRLGVLRGRLTFLWWPGAKVDVLHPFLLAAQAFWPGQEEDGACCGGRAQGLAGGHVSPGVCTGGTREHLHWDQGRKQMAGSQGTAWRDCSEGYMDTYRSGQETLTLCR